MSCNFLCGAGGNQSVFVPQAMATMCWGGDVGGGFLRGQTSLLTCTASDTCALNALDADQVFTAYPTKPYLNLFRGRVLGLGAPSVAPDFV